MKKLSIVAVVALMLVGVGCQSNGGGNDKEDEKATSQQAQKEEKKKDKEKSKEGSEEHPGDEHPGEGKEGEEHPGDEHPGEGKEGEEHPGDGKQGKKSDFSASEIKKAMKSHIDSESSQNGVFMMKDSKADKKLKLKFVKIHDPVRKMPEKGYFACTDFHVKGKKKKLYDLDFWLKPKDGSLEVTKSKIHKHPVKKDGKWKKKARYTFKNDKIMKLD